MGIVLGIGNTKPLYPYDYYYGVEWDTTVLNPNLKRIGKMELHVELPVQSQMRRCILKDNGDIAYYLDPNDSTKMDNGAPANLDGTDGQVMVEIPAYYMKFEADGNKRRCLMSTYELPGFHKWERCFVSAYEATIQRSTSKLSSVVNATPDYRGGNNDALLDETFRSFIGKPASDFSTRSARDSARARGSIEWNILTYDIVQRLFWLFVVEYATFQNRGAFNAGLTAEGFRQGGLGDGVTTVASFNDVFKGFPFIPIGVTNSLGNRTGEVVYQLAQSQDQSVERVNVKVNSYRGVEIPFGHLMKATDGIRVEVDKEPSGSNRVYASKNPNHFTDIGNENYRFVGLHNRKDGYIKDIAFGEFGDIIPTEIGGGANAHFCAFHLTYSALNRRQVYYFGMTGNSQDKASIIACSNTRVETDRSVSIGTRLCYIPQLK